MIAVLRQGAVLAKTVAACVTLATLPTVVKADWSAMKGPYAIRQTAGDIAVTVLTGGAPLFSARAFAGQQYRLLLKEYRLPSPVSGASPALFVRHRFRFISLTGALLAVRDEADVDVKANAIPSGKARFWTIDLKKGAAYNFGEEPLSPSTTAPGAFVDLRSLFPEKAIAGAVAVTELGRSAGSKPGAGLPDVMYDLAQVGRKSPNCFLPEPDATWSFAFTGSGPSGITADLGLPGQSYCRTNLTVLHLTLPRSALRKPFGPQVLAPASLPEVVVDIGTPRKQ